MLLFFFAKCAATVPISPVAVVALFSSFDFSVTAILLYFAERAATISIFPVAVIAPFFSLFNAITAVLGAAGAAATVITYQVTIIADFRTFFDAVTAGGCLGHTAGNRCAAIDPDADPQISVR